MRRSTLAVVSAGLLAAVSMAGMGPDGGSAARALPTYTGNLNMLVYIQDPGPEAWHYYQIEKSGRAPLPVDTTAVSGVVSGLQSGQRVKAYGRYRTASTSSGTVRYMVIQRLEVLN